MGEDINNYKEHMEELENAKEEAHMAKELNFEQDVRIDEEALDVEWLKQASLGVKYAAYVAELQRHYDLMELSVKEHRAKLLLAINADPERWTGKAKPTVGHIEAVIDTDSEYITMQADLIKLESELKYADMARRQIDTKKKALENLVILHGQSYFAGPKVPRDLSYEAKKQMEQEESNKQIAEAHQEK